MNLTVRNASKTVKLASLKSGECFYSPEYKTVFMRGQMFPENTDYFYVTELETGQVSKLSRTSEVAPAKLSPSNSVEFVINDTDAG